MRPRGVEIGPVVELRVRRAQVHLAIRGVKAIVPFAEDGLPLVEPDGRSPSRVELDHVTELVGDDPVEVARTCASAERVDVDHLPLGGKLVHPRRLLVRAAEVAGRRAGKPREDEVDARIGVDPGRPLRPVQPTVGRVHMVLEARARRTQAVQVDARVVRDPPLRVIGHESEGRRGLDVLLRGKVVRPEIVRASDVLGRRSRANRLEPVRRLAGAASHRSRELEPVRIRQRLGEERRGHVEARERRRRERRRRARHGRRGGVRGRGARPGLGRDASRQKENERENDPAAARHRAWYPSASVLVATTWPPRK